jgi:quercetin dioxygenase-like cupin family protein
MSAGAVVLGPIAYRTFTLESVCQESIGHEHNYDHVTIVISGSIRVKYSWTEPDGKVVEGESKEFSQGQVVNIKAGVRHTIKALEPNTHYLCVFSHRDFDGLVTQTYVGNAAATV